MSNNPGKSKTKRQIIKERKEKQKRLRKYRSLIIISIGVVAVVVVLAVVSLTSAPSIDDPIIAANPPNPRPMANDNAMGAEDAPVLVEEFSDFQCPACANFYQQTEPEIVERFVATGQVRFVYHSMGQWIGQESVAAAEAAYCAGDQNMFWEYHDVVFDNWNGENRGAYRDSRLIDMAEVLELNMDAFKTCFEGGKYSDRVRDDRLDGERRGATFTPTFYVNGEFVETQNLISTIELAIANANQ